MPTGNVRLLSHSPEHLLALRDNPALYQTQFGIAVAAGLSEFLGGPEVSESFQARLRDATAADPWRDGFGVLLPGENRLIGLASFNGPTDAAGEVEMSYAIAPAYTGRGYATGAVRLLIDFALASGQVQTLRAHTLPAKSASAGVLEKCGFKFRGPTIHPEDGAIWVWELPLPAIGLIS
ncbi:MAG: GNAT family N-acetyltransferase [Chthoniobacterales bacterium]